MSDSLSRRKLARASAELCAANGSPLPPLVLMTDDERLPDPLGATEALPRGSMVIVRSREGRRRQALARAMIGIARRRGLVVLIAGDAALALATGADGVHLPESRIGEASQIRARHHLLLTAAAHSLAALRRARCVDALILSPVFATASHPERRGLSPVRASLMARLAPVPVYALGGVDADNARRLSGFSGVAAVGALAVS